MRRGCRSERRNALDRGTNRFQGTATLRSQSRHAFNTAHPLGPIRTGCHCGQPRHSADTHAGSGGRALSLGSDSGAPAIEIMRCRKPDVAERFRDAFAKHLSDIGTSAPLSIPHPIGAGTLRVAKEPMRFRGDALVAAASAEQTFPTQMQRILLWIAAKEITLALDHWHAVLDHRRFASLAEKSADFIGIASVDGRPLYVNPAGCKVVGLSGVEEACKHHVLDFVMPEERLRLRDALWPIVIEKGRWIGEVAFRHFKTGKPIPFLVDWFRIDDAQSASPINVATVSRNLSSQKFAEARLRTFNRVLKDRVTERTADLEAANCRLVTEMAEHKSVNARLRDLQEELFHASRVSAAGQVAATLAHELSQPLTSTANLVNAARRMHGSNALSEEIHDVLAEASAEILRAGQIIHRLREFVTRGETEKRIESITSLVEDASALVLAGSSSLDLNLTFDFDPRATSVIADRVQIQQVLVNLMRNALEAVLLTERPRHHDCAAGSQHGRDRDRRYRTWV